MNDQPDQWHGDAPESPLVGGAVNQVVRVGETVRRSTGAWSPAVHALLRHLEAVGFDEVPRLLGLDEQGREVLTYIPGGAMPWTDWPAVMRGPGGLIQLGAMLRRYHDAVRNFVPPPNAVWRNPLARPFADADLIRHGDFSPFNTIWQGERLVGVIDWDFAQPGTALDDLGYLAWYAIPLAGDDRAAEYGFGPELDRAARLRTLADAYGGVEPATIVDAAIDVIRTERDDMEALARLGKEPWSTFVADGALASFAVDIVWIVANRVLLAADGRGNDNMV